MINYKDLPDYLGVEELRGYFDEFLEKRKYLNKYENLENLLELAERQWHTYELLDKSTQKKVSAYLLSILNCDDEMLMDTLLSIIIILGLQEVYNEILKNEKNIINKEVLELLKEFKREVINGDISNPFDTLE